METSCVANHSGLCKIQFEPVGRWFEACRRRQRHDRSVSIVEDKNVLKDDGDDDNDFLTEDDKNFMLSLEAKEWKKQDHYRVLGIEHLRIKATEEDIRKAFRKKLLRHHPDKKSATASARFQVPGLNEHEYFTCISSAFEVLGDSKRRQGYDSVDDSFDNSVPSVNNANKEDFYKIFGPAFDRNSSWSIKQPVPKLGTEKSTREEVEQFYNFWYNFESWREFSYLDEEEKDKAENRDERRWMEKQNRHLRQKRKKEEIGRIRQLIDNAYACDPRIKQIKEKERKRKEIEKKVKEESARRAEEEKQKALLAEKLEQEKEEKLAEEKALQLKKEKEKAKKMKAKERKAIRQAIKEQNYFQANGNDIVDAISKLETILDNMSLDDLKELRRVSAEDKTQFESAYKKEIERVDRELAEAEKQKQELLAEQAKKYTETNKTEGVALANKPWSETELQLLVKATTLFPVGTASRWQVIANYINEHSMASNDRTAKQIINKVKELQKLDPAVKKEIDQKAFERLEKQTNAKLVNATPKADPSVTDSVKEKPWQPDEQQLLEQALKTYPQGTAERWEKIAATIKGRTKRDCMLRYKELVEMVKAKRQAIAQAKQSK